MGFVKFRPKAGSRDLVLLTNYYSNLKKFMFMQIDIFMWRNNAKKSLVLTVGFREERARKVFLWSINFSTSIHFISDIISSKSGGVFDSARQVKPNHWALAP